MTLYVCDVCFFSTSAETLKGRCALPGCAGSMVRESELATLKVHRPVNVCAHGKNPETCGPCELHGLTKACLAAAVVTNLVTIALLVACFVAHGQP